SAEQTLAADLGIEHHSYQERQKQSHRYSEDAEYNGVPSGPPDFGVLEHFHIVADADELVVAEAQVFTETGVDGLNKGPKVQHYKTNDGGGNHKIAPVFLPPGGGGQLHCRFLHVS